MCDDDDGDGAQSHAGCVLSHPGHGADAVRDDGEANENGAGVLVALFHGLVLSAV